MRSVTCIAFLFVVAGCEPGDTEVAQKPDAVKPAPVKEAPAKAATHKVEKEPLKIEVNLKGTLEAEDMTEVYIRPEAWLPNTGGMLTVLKAVEHGTAVKKGATLIALDLERIDQAIRDLENEGRLTDVALRQAEEELPVLTKSTPLEAAAAERAKRIADEDLKRFLDIDRDLTEKNANFSVKSSANYLEYAKEELKQLEKMYRANDLREETEEIILKRQRNAVESAAHYLKQAEIHRDETVKIELPRKEQTLKEAALKQALALEKARSGLPLTLNQKILAFDKLKYERDKSAERLTKLRHDHEAMTIKAPADGIVYYGKCQHGQWSSAGSLSGKLQHGGMIMPDEVLLTIVKARPLFIRATVEEKDLQHIHAGAKGKAVVATLPDLRLPATVKEVSAIPVAPGSFEAKLGVDLAKGAESLMPGVACTVKLIAFAKADALTVPVGALFTEELDDDQHFVYLVGKDGKAVKHPVTVGKKTAAKAEILQGLKEGDEILLEKPAPAKVDGAQKKGAA